MLSRVHRLSFFRSIDLYWFSFFFLLILFFSIEFLLNFFINFFLLIFKRILQFYDVFNKIRLTFFKRIIVVVILLNKTLIPINNIITYNKVHAHKSFFS
jgi:hypothetical protein